MKKGFFNVFLTFIFVFFLASCSKADMNLEGISIRGIEDASISYEDEKISFRVLANVEEFNTDDIIIPDKNITLKAYDNNDNELTNKLSLSFGLNSFRLSFTLNKASRSWSLLITREKEEEIINEVSSIEILELASEYNLNDSFKGGRLKVNYKDGSSTTIPITIEMVRGFDTKATGERNITISYMGKEASSKIIVIDPNEPVEYDNAMLLDFAIRLEALNEDIGNFQFDLEYQRKYDFLKRNITPSELTRFSEYLNEAGLTNEAVASLALLLREDAYELQKRISSYDLEYMSKADIKAEILTHENVLLFKNILNRLTAILAPGQIAHLIPKGFMGSSISPSYIIFDNTLNKPINAGLDKIKELINNELFNSFIGFEARLDNISYEDRLLLASGIYDIINVIKDIDDDKLLLVGEILCIDSNNIGALAPSINALADILLELNKKTNGFNDIYLFLRGILERYNEYTALSDYENRANTLKLFDLAYSSIPELLLMLKKIDNKTLSSIYNLLLIILESPSANPATIEADICRLMKLINPALIRLKENEKSYNELIEALKPLKIAKASIDTILTDIDAASKLDPDKLSDKDIEAIMKVVGEVMELIGGAPDDLALYVNQNGLLVEKGSDFDTFLTLLKEVYEIKYNDPDTHTTTTIEINASHFTDIEAVKASLNTEGSYKFSLIVNEQEFVLYYYVYDKANIRLLPADLITRLIDTICYLNKSGELIYTDTILKLNSELGDPRDLNSMIKNEAFDVYLSDINTRLSLQIGEFSYELIYENNDGINLGLIKITTRFGSLYIPIHIVIVDEANPIITDAYTKSTGNSDRIAVLGTQESYIIVFDYGLRRVVKHNTELGLDINRLGKQECTIELDGRQYKLELEVIEKDLSLAIIDIVGSDKLSIENIAKHYERNDIRFDVLDSYSRRSSMDFKGLINTLWEQNKGEYTNMSYTFTHLSGDMNNALIELKLFGDGNLIFSDSFISSLISLEEWNSAHITPVDDIRLALEITEEEYLRLVGLNEGELEEVILGHLKGRKYKIDSLALDNTEYTNDILSYLRSNKIRYIINTCINEEKMCITASVDSVAGEIANLLLIERKHNEAEATISRLIPTTNRVIILDQNIQTIPEAIDFLAKYAIGEVRYPTGERILSGMELKELLSKMVIGYSVKYSPSNGLFTVKLNNYILSVNYKIGVYNNLSIGATGSPILTNLPTVDMEKFMLAYNASETNFSFTLNDIEGNSESLSFSNPDNKTTLLSAALNEGGTDVIASFNIKIGNHSFTKELKLPYIKALSKDYMISNKTIIYVADPNSPTSSEIASSLIISYNYRILAGVDYETLLSKVYFKGTKEGNEISFRIYEVGTDLDLGYSFKYQYELITNKGNPISIHYVGSLKYGYSVMKDDIHYNASKAGNSDIKWICENSFSQIRIKYFNLVLIYDVNEPADEKFIKENINISYEMVNESLYNVTLSYLDLSISYKLYLD